MRTRIWSMSAANRAQLPMDNHLATSQLMGEKKLPMMLITVMRVNRMLDRRTYKIQTCKEKTQCVTPGPLRPTRKRLAVKHRDDSDLRGRDSP